MTPQEMQTLESFLSQLTQARAGAKDPQAEALIAEAVARQPDAAYLLVQRALLLDHALTTARAQITTLQSQLQAAQAAQAGGANAFLDPANTWGNPASRVAPNPGYAPATAPMPMPAATQPAPAQPSRPGFLSGGLGGGFGGTLGSIATTAAGVAGGAFLFQGIENLFHHNSGSGFLGQSGMQTLPTETVINNYYENDRDTSSNVDTASRDDGLLDTGFSNDDSFNDDSTLI